MGMKFLALRAGRPLPPGRILVLIFVRGLVNTKAILRLEWLGQLKNPMTSLRIEPATFQLIAQCLNDLHYRAIQIFIRYFAKFFRPLSSKRKLHLIITTIFIELRLYLECLMPYRKAELISLLSNTQRDNRLDIPSFVA
jgi:hypothetical protein